MKNPRRKPAPVSILARGPFELAAMAVCTAIYNATCPCAKANKSVCAAMIHAARQAVRTAAPERFEEIAREERAAALVAAAEALAAAAVLHPKGDAKVKAKEATR